MVSVSESLSLPYTDEQLRTFVEDAVARPGTERRPRLYAVTGSHVYGFDAGDSDVDLRGVHTVPGEEYASLDRPASEVTVNMDGVTEGFEAFADVDLRSYELRAFGELVVKANYNVIELVLEAPVVMNGLPLEVDALRALIRDHLPMNVPHAYLGMAKSNYYKHLDPDKPESYDPRPKKFLYVLRGLLGAQYVLDEGDVEADVRELATTIDVAPEGLIGELIERKREAPGADVAPETAERARDRIAELFGAVDVPPRPDKAGFREAVDDWMRKVRL